MTCSSTGQNSFQCSGCPRTEPHSLQQTLLLLSKCRCQGALARGLCTHACASAKLPVHGVDAGGPWTHSSLFKGI